MTWPIKGFRDVRSLQRQVIEDAWNKMRTDVRGRECATAGEILEEGQVATALTSLPEVGQRMGSGLTRQRECRAAKPPILIDRHRCLCAPNCCVGTEFSNVPSLRLQIHRIWRLQILQKFALQIVECMGQERGHNRKMIGRGSARLSVGYLLRCGGCRTSLRFQPGRLVPAQSRRFVQFRSPNRFSKCREFRNACLRHERYDSILQPLNPRPGWFGGRPLA
jgi:hypothetical protein